MSERDIEVKQRDGRKWSVTSSGIESLTRRYRVRLDTDYLGANGEVATFTGLPAIGSAHPTHTNLRVTGYEIAEGEGVSKGVVDVDVKYARQNIEVTGSGSEQTTQQVTEWGWEGSTTERELVMDMDGVAVLNSAGDPFDSVPMVSVASPVFTKVIKFEERQEGAMAFNCKVNDEAIEIGDWECDIATLLCTVSERRVFNDDKWKYEYTIQLRYRSNSVILEGGSEATECGWDVAITDAGMRQKDSETGQPIPIQMPDSQTGKMLTVTTSTLLDGAGSPATWSQSSNPDPYNMRFKAYERASFPAWFYSEPGVEEESSDGDDTDDDDE